MAFLKQLIKTRCHVFASLIDVPILRKVREAKRKARMIIRSYAQVQRLTKFICAKQSKIQIKCTSHGRKQRPLPGFSYCAFRMH